MIAKNRFLHSMFLLTLQFTSCTYMDAIKTNQTVKDGSLVISKENNFALGFFSLGNSSFRYLGIWYHKVPEQTVVWVANRGHPINGSSGFLSINQYGNLVLYGDSDRTVPVWSANCSVGYTCEAQLLDSGNLVLVQTTSKGVVWQSFDYPTDTMLAGMKLGLNRKTGQELFLTSWRSADDPATGDFSFKLYPSSLPQFFLYRGTKRYWRTASWPWRGQWQLYKESFVNIQDEVYFVYTPIDDSIILRIMVDHTGFLKVVTWHVSDHKWKEFWAAPKHQCDWYGKCGAYSTCEPVEITRYECACLPGYELKDARNWYLRDGSGGCVSKGLESSSVCDPGEGFVKVDKVLLPDSSFAVWVNTSMSRANCEKQCKMNCSCSAYAIVDAPGIAKGCITWHGELMDTTYDRNDRYDLYVRVDALELAENARKSKGSHEKGLLTVLIPAVLSTSLIISVLGYLWLRKRGEKETWVANELRRSGNDVDLDFFKLSTLSAATKNFSPDNKLGEGGFGSVYKGQLPNGEEIAVKRLSKNSGQGIEEFTNEVKVIGKLQHRNLVKLVGCCIQGGEPMLIYEYLPNKSLDSFLFDETRELFLDWSTRFVIIVGIARGILYLHQDSRLRIIHRDLKCSNILLDAEMTPKISDFGMARIFGRDQIQDETRRVMGTFGYMSPEYAAFGKISVKSDVFSFGVMLLEIVSGKRNNRYNLQDSSLTLIGHVWELWREERALEIVDSSLQELYHPQEVLKCIQIGLLCVQENAMDRPSMLAVVFMLSSSEAAIPSPKEPAFIFREICSKPHTLIEVQEDGGGGDGGGGGVELAINKHGLPLLGCNSLKMSLSESLTDRTLHY